MKRFISLAMAVVFALSLVWAGCFAAGNPAYAVKPRKITNRKLVVGLVPVTMNTSYTMTINGAKKEIAKLGNKIDLIVQAPSNNTSTITDQGNILESLIQKKVDAIVLATESDTSMLPYLREAAKANIPVFLFNMSTIDQKDIYYVSSIGYDQYGAGKSIGKWVADTYKEGKIGVLEGYPGVVNTQRMNGFKDAIAKAPGLKIVASQVANWNRESGQKVTEGILTAHPDMTILYGPFDEMVLGGLVVVKERNLMKQIHVVGFGCTKDGVTSVKNGEMAATINVMEYETGFDIIDAVNNYCVKGQNVKKVIYRNCDVYDGKNINSLDMARFN
ncbi:MAG TPA: sugar ABC transporter substrate-binding protein [Firmicutes bacterium]|jgi:ABC-type sugar transport system substrate-binding protein|nr:sugar ABC transporter substrate-binding protein [Bacillota bacterium]